MPTTRNGTTNWKPKSANGKLAGIHYVIDRSKRTRTGQPTRRKPTLAELESRAELSERTQTQSNAIREQCAEDVAKRFREQSGHGRPRDVLTYLAGWEHVRELAEPVPPNFYRQALTAEVAARRAEADCKPKQSRSTSKPQSRPAPTNGQAATSEPIIELTPALAFRLSGAELKALASGNGPSEVAMLEIQRRKDKRQAKAAA